MSLFSSKSKSTSSTYNQTQQTSGTIGDLSSDNTVIGGDYSPVGLAGDELASVLTNNTDIFNSTVKAIQGAAELAINTSAAAYSDATGTTKAISASIKPIVAYVAVAVVALLLLKGKK